MPHPVANGMIAGLTEKDYIEKTGDDYRLIVPIYKQLLLEKT